MHDSPDVEEHFRPYGGLLIYAGKAQMPLMDFALC